jgi:glyoxylase-like metal-dependent hydrolase (beta-lactamase superfamily II)/ferredoxin
MRLFLRRLASSGMARAELRRSENVAGPVFVDSTCIDCDTCRWMAPQVFARRAGQSAVVHQPTSTAEARRAAQAAVACPTASIAAPGMAEAARDFPVPVLSGDHVASEVFHCGYHSPDSFGATSYFVRRPEGNLLVDVPRFAAPLVKRLEEMGGVRWILLTHRDDVAEHDKFARHFGATRVLHRRDAPIPGGPVERFLEGEGATELAPGVTAIPVPGHTPGHVCFQVRGAEETFLFTGDHLAWDDDQSRLEAWPDVCWYDWAEQTASMRRLVDVEFDWVLPGHGRRAWLASGERRPQLERLVHWMERQ